MNAREFENIMQSEGLKTTKAVMVMLQEAKRCQRNIKSMSLYKHKYAVAYIEQQKKRKTRLSGKLLQWLN